MDLQSSNGISLHSVSDAPLASPVNRDKSMLLALFPGICVREGKRAGKGEEARINGYGYAIALVGGFLRSVSVPKASWERCRMDGAGLKPILSKAIALGSLLWRAQYRLISARLRSSFSGHILKVKIAVLVSVWRWKEKRFSSNIDLYSVMGVYGTF